MLVTGYLSVLRCGIETGVAQVLLQHPQPVTRIIMLHSVYREGVPKTVGANSPCLASFRVHQVTKASPPGTLPHHLSGAVAIDAEYEHLFLSGHGATALDMTLEHLQGITVHRQGS